MKTSKSPENTEVTPSKKKLKQARLPFMLISDVSPKVEQQTRKRKLSTPFPEPVTKINKLSKENGLIDDLVVISDEECKDEQETQKVEISMNPFVKLVDTAWKKKQQKSKKKKTNKRISKETVKLNQNGLEPNPNVSYSDEKDIERDKATDKPNESDIDNNDVVMIEADKADKIVEPVHKNDDTATSIVNKLTPKRSPRNNSKLEKKNDSNTSISKVNDSVSSTISTPKRSRSSSATNSQGNDSMNDSTANLTPKQLQKRLESAKKKEEREKEKQEREKKRQLEKDEKAKQRLEKEEQRKKEKEEKEEAKKKEKEEKEEQKKKEREEKEKQKELERKLKEEKEDLKRKEREEKEEQKKKEKEAKEEEKRKKQEAIELEKQEQELKKKKAAEAFVNFFVPKQKVDKDQASDGPISKNSMLSSFTIKGDMRLAPTVRVDLTDVKREALDYLMEQQNVEALYLKNIKDGTDKPMSSGRTWPMDDKDDDDDVIIVEDELPITGAGEIMTCEPAVREKLHPKLLSFHENRRPPYWGTWRKKSAFVKPRRPFGQDEKQLDYEVDSDDDWEEEQEGESIDGSAAGSDDEQDADEYEVDNEVFVPHGYLSDEEATMGEDDVLSFSPETQKARLKHLEDEFESEMKKPTEKIKPRLYGLLWENSNGGKPDNCVDTLWNYFGKLAMIMNDPTALLLPSKEPEESDKKKVKKKKLQKKEDEADSESPKVEKKKKSKTENKDSKPKTDNKKNTPDVKKNQPGINSFLTKLNQHK